MFRATVAVDGLDLRIPEGSIYGIAGTERLRQDDLSRAGFTGR